MEPYFSKFLCGFRKGLSTQYCLLVMMEKMRSAMDSKLQCGLLLTDLSKAFDCVKHDLLIAKLHAYNFDYNALKLVNSYLSNRKQRTKIDNTFSSWHDIFVGVPQGSNIGPILFNVFINDIFYTINNVNIANFADDNSPFTTNKHMEEVIKVLEEDSNQLNLWYKYNYLKPNCDKYHLLLSSKDDTLSVNIDNVTVQNTCEEKKILGILLNNDFSCIPYVKKICRQASKKLHALTRISKFMSQHKRKVVMHAFINSQFSYCPLIWTFHGNRKLNDSMNKIQERALRLVYGYDTSTFNELLLKDNSFTVHERNLQKLAIEVFKYKNHLSPAIMNEIFKAKNYSYKLRDDRILRSHNVKSVYNGTETIRYRAQKTWDMVPDVIKISKSLIEFKRKIKQWKPTNCKCRICREYIDGVGFID